MTKEMAPWGRKSVPGHPVTRRHDHADHSAPSRRSRGGAGQPSDSPITAGVTVAATVRRCDTPPGYESQEVSRPCRTMQTA